MLLFSGGPIFESSIPLSVFGIDRQDAGVPRYRLLVCGGEGHCGPQGPGTHRAAWPGGDLAGGHRRGAGLAFDHLAATGGGARRAAPGARGGSPHSRTVHRRLRAGRRRTAGRPTGDDPLDVRTDAGQALPVGPRRPARTLRGRRRRTDLRGYGGRNRSLSPHRADGPRQRAAARWPAVLSCPRAGVAVRSAISIDLYQRRSAPTLAEVVAWALEHLHEQFDVETLAARAYMSRRTFDRRFRSLTGALPCSG